MSAGMMERTAPGQVTELPPSMVERMTLILDLFASREIGLSLEQIAQETGLPRSTAHRILDQLVRLEWLERTAGSYGLGRRSLLLGGSGDHGELRAAASPYLHDLLLRTGAVVHLGVLDQGRVHYLDKLGGRSASSVPSRVGGHAPAYCTGLGKAMLAWLSAEEVEELVGDNLPARTANTIAETAGLHHELARIRARGGLALERGECFAAFACAAAAIRGPRGPIGAISIVTAAGTPIERVAPLVVDAVQQIADDIYPDVFSQRHRSGAGLKSAG